MMITWEIPKDIDITDNIFIKYLKEHNDILKSAGYDTHSVKYFKSVGYHVIDKLIHDNIVIKYSRDRYAWMASNGKYQVTFFGKISLLDQIKYFFVKTKYKIGRYHILYFYTDDVFGHGIKICSSYESPWVSFGMDNSEWCGECFRCKYIIYKRVSNIVFL